VIQFNCTNFYQIRHCQGCSNKYGILYMSLCTFKGVWKRKGKAPFILNLDTSWSWMVYFANWPNFTWGIGPDNIKQDSDQDPDYVRLLCRKIYFFSLLWNEPRLLGWPAHDLVTVLLTNSKLLISFTNPNFENLLSSKIVLLESKPWNICFVILWLFLVIRTFIFTLNVFSIYTSILLLLFA